MSEHPSAPVSARFWSPGAVLLLFVALIGGAFIVARFLNGIGYISNLSNSRPWGLWVAIDVATGVALAAGGFTTAALAYILGRRSYGPITRPALLTATLGYTFVVIGLLVDIGRPWAIWSPLVNWQPNSVLFEVAICVVFYLHVLYLEFMPVVAERFSEKIPPLKFLNRILGKVMWFFIICGVVLSCMHQSSLGSLMLVAQAKVHPLWLTPILPLLFLMSAIAVGFPMVIFETIITSKSLRLDPELRILTPLSRYCILLLGLYMVVKIGDVVYRGAYTHLLDGTTQSNSFLIEVVFGVIVPWILFLIPGIRNTRRGLFIASAMVVAGVVLNRINVFIVAYVPPFGDTHYFPSIGEIAVTSGLIAALMLVFRFMVVNFPVIAADAQENRT